MKSKVLILLKSVAVFNVIALRTSVSAFHILPVSNNKISAVQLFFKLTESLFDNALKKLITDKGLLDRLSKKTREKIINYYSVQSNRQNFLDLFDRKKQPTYDYGNNRNVA